MEFLAKENEEAVNQKKKANNLPYNGIDDFSSELINHTYYIGKPIVV